jgi:hypothetical protein
VGKKIRKRENMMNKKNLKTREKNALLNIIKIRIKYSNLKTKFLMPMTQAWIFCVSAV